MIRSTRQPSSSARVPGAAYLPLLPALAELPRGQGGTPLPAGLRRRLEGLYGADFSGVQIHLRPEVQAAGALALTRGLDIYFAPGRYDPATPRGLELLGHELTHVMQQCTGRVGTPPGDAGAIVLDAALEAEADRMGRLAARALGGQTPTPAFVPPPAGPRLLPPVRDRLQPVLNVTYWDLGENKQLNEIVMVGSHDAGISGDAADNVKTQDLNIFDQAEAGVRYFDLRVAAFAGPTLPSGLKTAELKSYHAGGGLKTSATKERLVSDVGRQEEIKQTKFRLGAGGWYGDVGLGLTAMLAQARRFVQANTTEFLILRFDKCSNWALIAEACQNVLGANRDCRYTDEGNLNTKTLRDLRGKVIVLFMEDGWNSMDPLAKSPGSGILPVKNLQKGGQYDPSYNGLQYYGKGGTKLSNLRGDKIAENLETQDGYILTAVAACEPEVMGMVYWTTTGLLESIQERNNLMWSNENKARLRQLWKQGLKDAILQRTIKLGLSQIPRYVTGHLLKVFMPNIVMIDFVDNGKCDFIYDLNALPASEIAQLLAESQQGAQQQGAQQAGPDGNGSGG
jgi:hypothetical protein